MKKNLTVLFLIAALICAIAAIWVTSNWIQLLVTAAVFLLAALVVYADEHKKESEK